MGSSNQKVQVMVANSHRLYLVLRPQQRFQGVAGAGDYRVFNIDYDIDTKKCLDDFDTDFETHRCANFDSDFNTDTKTLEEVEGKN